MCACCTAAPSWTISASTANPFARFSKIGGSKAVSFIISNSSILVRAAEADRITSPEAALDRFRAACESDGEIKKGAPPEVLEWINGMRKLLSLTVARKSPKDFAELRAPKTLTLASRGDRFGSRQAVIDSTSDTWVLTYEMMTGMTVYLDAATGKTLCVAFIPEG